MSQKIKKYYYSYMKSIKSQFMLVIVPLLFIVWDCFVKILLSYTWTLHKKKKF